MTDEVGNIGVVALPDQISVARAHEAFQPDGSLTDPEQQAGIETVLTYACRDRNLLGIQSDMLGAHAMGLRNVLLVTGDPGRVGDYPDATAVFDVDSIGLTNVVSRLNHGCDVGGQAIGTPTSFHVGVSVNPAAANAASSCARVPFSTRFTGSPGKPSPVIV